MDLLQFREYCLQKAAVTETLPFGPDTLVMKVGGKVFAATGLDEADFRVNLKCDPQRSPELRDRYPEIVPGWHMNKKHWNTVYVGTGSLPEKLFRELIDHSYELVVAGMTKKLRAELGL